MANGFRSFPIFVCPFLVTSRCLHPIPESIRRCSRDCFVDSHVYNLVRAVLVSNGFRSFPIFVCPFLVTSRCLHPIPESIRRCSCDSVLSTPAVVVVVVAFRASGLVGGFRFGYSVHSCGLSCEVCARIHRTLSADVFCWRRFRWGRRSDPCSAPKVQTP